MRQVAEQVLSPVAQDDVGEVVVFVDDEVEGIALLVRLVVDQLHLGARVVGGLDPLAELLAVIGFVAFDKTVHHNGAIGVEVFFQFSYARADEREVEVDDLERILQQRGVLLYPQPVEQGVEAVGLGDVIIRLKHGDEHALAEAARTDQEQVFSGILQQRKIWSLVHIIQIFVPHFFEAGHTVRNAFYLCHNRWIESELTSCKDTKSFPYSRKTSCISLSTNSCRKRSRSCSGGVTYSRMQNTRRYWLMSDVKPFLHSRRWWCPFGRDWPGV